MNTKVVQETFDGPLDLLLQLIETEKLDITTISLAAVTDDYLAHVERLERHQLPEVAEWLVVAARLLVLKSRALLPQEIGDDFEESADDLAAQLAEYKAFKELAGEIEAGLGTTAFSLGKAPSTVELPSQFVATGVDVQRLHEAFVTVLEHLPSSAPPAGPDLEPVVSLEERIAAVQVQLKPGPLPFERLFSAVRSRLGLIVTFLAILELVKQRVIAVAATTGSLTIQLRSSVSA